MFIAHRIDRSNHQERPVRGSSQSLQNPGRLHLGLRLRQQVVHLEMSPPRSASTAPPKGWFCAGAIHAARQLGTSLRQALTCTINSEESGKRDPLTGLATAARAPDD